jgi:mono/diheme cytochrome c family protein
MRNVLVASLAGACALTLACARVAPEGRPDAPAPVAADPPSTSASAAAGPGKLNKFTGNAAAVEQGRALYLQYGCSGCHGVGGGGGMAPPITDDVWKFGSDDATLFKIIKGQLPDQTMPRVYAEMPDDEVWKILAYVRSQYAGAPDKVNW